MRKNVFPLSIFLLLISFFWGCEEKIEPGRTVTASAPVVKARVAAARITPQPRTYEAVGTVVAGTATTVSSKVMGVVKRVHVKEGDTVRKGDLLATIDDIAFQSRLREVEASLGETRKAEAAALSAVASAKAASDLAHTTYVRYLNLLADQSVSSQEFDEVEARDRQSRAALAKAHEMTQAARRAGETGRGRGLGGGGADKGCDDPRSLRWRRHGEMDRGRRPGIPRDAAGCPG